MEKKGEPFIEQLIDTLDNGEVLLEKAHHFNEAIKFNSIKRTMLQVQKRLMEELR